MEFDANNISARRYVRHIWRAPKLYEIQSKNIHKNILRIIIIKKKSIFVLLCFDFLRK